MTTTIYFSGSISSGRADVAQYRRIIAALEQAGHRVIAGAVAAEHIGEHGETLTPADIFTRDLGWIESSEVLVAEVSAPSTGVGYEIAAARFRYEIPVICLYRPAFTKRCSAMVAGDPGIELIEYGDADFELMIERLLEAIANAGE